jgi:S1-C subfamily serine protease
MRMGNARRSRLLSALLVCAGVAGEGSAFADSRPWIGLELCNMPAQNPFGREPVVGAYVLLVREGSPASLAGVMQHDIVIGIDDRVVASAEDLVCAIATRAPGNIARLAILRSGAQRVVGVSLTHWPTEMLPAPFACSAPSS